MNIKFMIFISIFIMSAFALQYYLGFKQIKHFGDEYSKMRREGKVAIGRRPGKIQSGTIILFSIDNNGVIRYGKKLQGTTILAKFRDFNQFNGRNIGDIRLEDDEMKKELKITREAVMDAVNNYNAFINGHKIPEKKSPFGQLYKKFVG
ncbi:DNA-binding transcriptional regulator of glucitol operon [Clostridium sp. USBA 49]|uniref:transcriptional regulator GutM n=1 Tax=Clostridium sp. USBA 49 TaxID=1881060 RepID=UPI000999FC0C|nr:transcriptional regulator GutM [Clostridium sp. USBA 49]SKA79109.1 DNA-binding transcriptional regulator of glucitol operon [Clostridium sp. USBA 49]